MRKIKSCNSSPSLLAALFFVLVAREECAQMADCPILGRAELGSTSGLNSSGLVFQALRSTGEGVPQPIQLVDSNIVCLAQGSRRDLYRMVSVIATYINEVNEPPLIRQFHFQCVDGSWSSNVLNSPNNSLSRLHPPVGNLTTSVRQDCRQCTDVVPTSPAEHCVACSSDCIGLMRCGAMLGNSACCNYFDMTGGCTQSCPASSTPNNNFECECDQGFMFNGTLCVNIDECSSEPCQNGGTCTDFSGSYSCSCSAGFTGQNCSAEINNCSSQICENGGTCSNVAGGYLCSCAAGYTGKNCSIDIDDCSPNPCQNGGQCEDRSNGFVCSCAAGYTDQTCVTEISLCESDPCMNGAICIPLNNVNYSCLCRHGFTGLRCETDINECDSEPCSNGGTCVNTHGSFSCQCGTNWMGPTCEVCSIANCASCVGNNAMCPRCSTGYTPTPEGLCDACADRFRECLQCSAMETACLECTPGFKLEDRRCKMPCQTNNCQRCSDDGTICAECEDSFNLDVLGNECNFQLGSSLHQSEIIGIMVGAVLFAIVTITGIACIMSWAYSKYERPKMTGQPNRSIFQDHGENRNPIFKKGHIILYENEDGITKA